MSVAFALASPLGQEVTFTVELLDALVIVIGHVNISRGVQRHAERITQLAVTVALTAPLHQVAWRFVGFFELGQRGTRKQNVESQEERLYDGWADHDRYAEAFPFIEGSTSLDIPWEDLSPEQQRGRQLYESACITCHDQPNAGSGDALVFELRAVSYPRRHFSHREQVVDVVSGASPYAVHDIAPDPSGLSDVALAGRALYEENCAFCHASDGTGRNWIGSFLEPRPRDFTDPEFRLIQDEAALEQRILVGIPGTSMPAWRNVLDDAEVDAIIAYLQQAFPATE